MICRGKKTCCIIYGKSYRNQMLDQCCILIFAVADKFCYYWNKSDHRHYDQIKYTASSINSLQQHQHCDKQYRRKMSDHSCFVVSLHL